MDSERESRLRYLGLLDDGVRGYNVGGSDYSRHVIQPWSIWMDYGLNAFDADIVKRVLRTKGGTASRIEDYMKIIHVCNERIRQLRLEDDVTGDEWKDVVMDIDDDDTVDIPSKGRQEPFNIYSLVGLHLVSFLDDGVECSEVDDVTAIDAGDGRPFVSLSLMDCRVVDLDVQDARRLVLGYCVDGDGTRHAVIEDNPDDGHSVVVNGTMLDMIMERLEGDFLVVDDGGGTMRTRIAAVERMGLGDLCLVPEDGSQFGTIAMTVLESARLLAGWVVTKGGRRHWIEGRHVDECPKGVSMTCLVDGEATWSRPMSSLVIGDDGIACVSVDDPGERAVAFTMVSYGHLVRGDDAACIGDPKRTYRLERAWKD